jgi:hypothetical protein
LVDGYSGFVPKHHRELALTVADLSSPRSADLLAGLGVRWVIVHSTLVDAFLPGRSGQIRASLEPNAGFEHEADFGTDWVYRVTAPTPGSAPSGRLWATPSGEAFLVLQAVGTGAVLSPGSTVQVDATWEAAGSGRRVAGSKTIQLPLMIGQASIVPLSLAGPGGPGPYRLHLSAKQPQFEIKPFDGDVNVPAGARPASASLLPLQLARVDGHWLIVNVLWERKPGSKG